MRPTALLLSFLLVLAACGVDGEPEPPTRSAQSVPGVSISGTASIGITAGS